MRNQLAIICTAVALLGACGPISKPNDDQLGEACVGGTTPEAVTESFFEDLRNALRDPNLADPDVRTNLVENLACYFAPNERDDQRLALDSALASLVTGIKQVQPEKKVLLELSFDRNSAQRMPANDPQGETNWRAMVRLNNARLRILITNSADPADVEYEEEVGLEKLIGNPDGAVPTVNVGGRWFLSEGWAAARS